VPEPDNQIVLDRSVARFAASFPASFPDNARRLLLRNVKLVAMVITALAMLLGSILATRAASVEPGGTPVGPASYWREM
jgi:hypothetical protein